MKGPEVPAGAVSILQSLWERLGVDGDDRNRSLGQLRANLLECLVVWRFSGIWRYLTGWILLEICRG